MPSSSTRHRHRARGRGHRIFCVTLKCPVIVNREGIVRIRIALADYFVSFAFTTPTPLSSSTPPTPVTQYNMKVINILFLTLSLVVAYATASDEQCPSGPEIKYIGTSAEMCSTIRFFCQEDQRYFSEGDCGCGCMTEPKPDE
jgi:hypothetical protein